MAVATHDLTKTRRMILVSHGFGITFFVASHGVYLRWFWSNMIFASHDLASHDFGIKLFVASHGVGRACFWHNMVKKVQITLY